MSEAFDRGRNFERRVATLLRKKLGARVERDRRSGAGINRSDISDYYQEIPLHMEIKDQETIKIKEWFRQSDAASSFNMAPAVIFHADEEILATLRFSDLLNFLLEIQDQKAEIDDLRAPILSVDHVEASKNGVAILSHRTTKEEAEALAKKAVEVKKPTATKFCKAGHLADQWGYCQQLDCKYSRGYKSPKKARK